MSELEIQEHSIQVGGRYGRLTSMIEIQTRIMPPDILMNKDLGYKYKHEEMRGRKKRSVGKRVHIKGSRKVNKGTVRERVKKGEKRKSKVVRGKVEKQR